MITIARVSIVLAYLCGLFPWVAFACTQFQGFLILGMVFAIVLVLLWPKAKRDWAICGETA